MQTIIYPTKIELGSYVEGNKRTLRFNPNNPRHISMFKRFYGTQLSIDRKSI